MTLYLNRERMRLVVTNEKGRVTKRKKYKFGDEVDPDMFMDQGRIDVLTEKGALVEDKDDLDPYAGFRLAAGVSPSQQRGQATTAAFDVAGAATTGGNRHGDISDTGEGSSDEESTTLVPEDTHEDEPQGGGAATSATEGEGSDVEMVDDYSSMDRGELENAAKDAGIRYVGVSSEDLKVALRESDNA